MPFASKRCRHRSAAWVASSPRPARWRISAGVKRASENDGKPLLRAGHDLAGRDPDAPLDPELGERVSHLERSPKRAQCIVLVQHRHPEHRHNCITDEFLDRAAVILDDRLHPLEIARQDEPHCFGIELLAERRRTGDVTEQDRHRLPLLTNRGWCRQRSSARVTETGTVPVLATARRTNHRLSLRTAKQGGSGNASRTGGFRFSGWRRAGRRLLRCRGRGSIAPSRGSARGRARA